MNEEIKREGELSEQALENASGGEAGPIGYVQLAENACHSCGRKGKCSHYGAMDLVRYLRDHRDVTFNNCKHCPFYDEAK